jgi:3-deoxy-manno-octulosonate cytidylyltransferase (CMP-KDO synthetase)
VKVVTDAKGFALYFSRAPIPYIRDNGGAAHSPQPMASAQKDSIWGYRHVGVYVYRRDFLLKFSRLRPTPLERTEGLEQLRALDHGYRIRVMDVDEPSVEVDTPQDLQKAEAYLKGME